MRKKRYIAIGLLLVVAVALAILFHNPLRTLATLRRVDDHPLYVMTYYGGYGFDEFLKHGLPAIGRSDSSIKEISTVWACTTFAALNEEGDAILGRNFDWRNQRSLLLFTDPPDGYASVSMVDIAYLGYGAVDPSWINRAALLGAPYLPFDGMNEAGVTAGMMAVPNAESPPGSRNVTISSLHAIRLVLDYAKDVEEAISLLQNYTIDFGDGPPIHYLIADASRHSVVIEYVNGEMRVIRNKEPWQVSTNFIISDERPEGANPSCWRYNKAYETLEHAEGSISTEEAMAILKGTSQPGDYYTMWSVVYDMTSGNIQVAMGRKYDEVREFKLEMMANQ
jgi:hypothetical protein